MHYLANIALRCQQITLQIFRPRQESVKQVHDIAVGVGTDDILGIQPCREFQSQPFIHLVFHANARFRAETSQRAEVLHTHAWIDDPIAAIHPIIKVSREFCGVFNLPYLHPDGIEGLEIRAHAHHLQSVFNSVLTEHIFEIKSKVEPVHTAESILQPVFFQSNFIIARCEMATHQDGRTAGHDGEIAASTVIRPPQIR